MTEPGQHLLRTLQSQPEEAARLLQETDSVAAAAARVAGARRLFVVGIGTSFHGALAGQFLLRSAGFEAWAVRSFDFAQYGPRLDSQDAMILVSHRGTKRFSVDSLALFRGLGQRWVAITGEESPLEGAGLIRTSPAELSAVHTASHTTAMLRLAQLAVALAGESRPAWAEALAQVPAALGQALNARPAMAAMAGSLKSWPLHFAGGGPAWATALEGALKVREAAHVPAEGHDLETLLHGPLVSLDASQATVLVAEPGAAWDRTRQVASALEAIGVPVCAVGSSAADLPGVRWSAQTPRLPEVLAPIVNVIPLQWLAYEVARGQGVDADTFRRDEAAYAEAQARAQISYGG